MSDLPDPTALPDGVRTAAMIVGKEAFFIHRDQVETLRDRIERGVSTPLDQTPDAVWTVILDAVTPILAAHFAAELDGLRAQIEEARAHVARIDILMYETGSESVGKLADILAQSPRGTVVRIQTEALEKAAWIAEHPTWHPLGRLNDVEHQTALRITTAIRAAETALREGAGQ